MGSAGRYLRGVVVDAAGRLCCALGVNAGCYVVASVSGRAQGGGTAGVRAALQVAGVPVELVLESACGLGPSAMAALFSYENFGMSIKQAEYCKDLA